MFILIFRPARLFNSKKGLYVLLYTKAMLYSIWCTISIDWNSMTKPYTCKSVHRDTVFFFWYIILYYIALQGETNIQTNYLLTICKNIVVDNQIKCSMFVLVNSTQQSFLVFISYYLRN